MTTASIVIVTYGQRSLTEQCLRSLEHALGDRLGRDWELVLVDNNSPDDTPALLREWSDRARVLLLEENRNFAGGCNAGAAAASGEVLVFLNNDTEVPAGALETLVEQAHEPGIGAVGCRLLYPNRTIQHAGVAFIRGFSFAHIPMPQHVLVGQDEHLAATQAIFETDCVTAACFAVRRELFRRLDGFDEQFRNGFEDVDLCLRIRAAGETIVYRGDVTLIHHEGASRGRGKKLLSTPEKRAAMEHNDRLLIARWGTLLEQDDALAASVWDARLEDAAREPDRTEAPTDSVILGNPWGIGPIADETRAFLRLWSAHGRRVAAYNTPLTSVLARLGEQETREVSIALSRPGYSAAQILYLPPAVLDHELVPDSIVRFGFPGAITGLSAAKQVWASCRAVAERLIAGGLAPERLSVVPPPLSARSVGAGGGGVLVTVPVQDPELTAMLLSELRRLDRIELTLLPTTFRRGFEDVIAEQLPHARVLGPCNDEDRFAALAAAADVILAADRSDPFERRALVAASVGAATVTLRGDGPAAELLGADVVCEPLDTARALAGALDQSPLADRRARAAAVTEACRLHRIDEASGVPAGSRAG